MEKRVKNLVEIALKKDEGFTVDKRTLKPIEKGYSVAIKETQNSFGFHGLLKAFIIGLNITIVDGIGGWFNKDDSEYYYDAVVIFDAFEKALQFAKENEQIAIFDLSKGKEIKLNDKELIQSYL